MKHIFTLVIFTLLSLATFADRPVIKCIAWWGNWSSKSSWNLNRVPVSGDSIVIPATYGIVVDAVTSLNNVYINVLGTMQIKKAISLNSNSVVAIGANGLINSFGADRQNEVLSIGGVNKYDKTTSYNVRGIAFASQYSGVAPAGFSGSAVLPVKFVSFTATKAASGILLRWATAQEVNNSHFEIEKSNDATNWKSIAIVFGNGTTSTVISYTYSDKNEKSAVVYYRIRQVDLDGNATYTSVKMIRSEEGAKQVSVYASSKNSITINLNADIKENLQVVVLNMNGQVVARQGYSNPSSKINVPVSNLSNGIYLVAISDNTGWKETSKIAL